MSGWAASHSRSIRAASAALAAPASASARGRPGVVVPRMWLALVVSVPHLASQTLAYGWSVGSTLALRSRALSASVRAMSSIGHSSMSREKRAETRREICVEGGTRTFPARWPHFLPPCNWSSRWIAAAPASAKSFASLITDDGPPWLKGASQRGIRKEYCPGAPRVGISDDRAEVVCVRQPDTLLGGGRHPGIVVLAVVQLLGAEDAVDLVRDRRIRIVPAAPPASVGPDGTAADTRTQSQGPPRYCPS